MITRKSILQKTVQVSGFTFLSRILGIVREVLTVRYLGASALSDAFLTAWKIPNSLRKIFAEGALSAAFVPSLVSLVREKGHSSIFGLMTLALLVFQGIIAFFCLFFGFVVPPLINVFLSLLNTYWGFSFQPINSILELIAPGFSAEQLVHTSSFLYVLMPFIFLISASALLAGALQAFHHFTIPALGSVILNLFYIAGLVIGITWQTSPLVLCWLIIVGGIVQLLSHVLMYWTLGCSFAFFTFDDWQRIRSILHKFWWCTLSMCVVEVGLFLDTSFASMLSKGSISLVYYANRFMQIPLGIFAVAFSTILLPYFARIGTYAPKRLGFYVMEATKLVWWITFPAAIMMILLARPLFLTIFFSEKFTMAQVDEAAMILQAASLGLFFFAINKILLNAYYALHETKTPGVIAALSVIINAVLNWFLMGSLKATGLSLATTIAGVVQTIFLFIFLKYLFGLKLYFAQLFNFMQRYVIQVGVIGLPCVGLYWGLWYAINVWLPATFITGIAYWTWVLPLCAAFMYAVYQTRFYFKTNVLFLGD